MAHEKNKIYRNENASSEYVNERWKGERASFLNIKMYKVFCGQQRSHVAIMYNCSTLLPKQHNDVFCVTLK